MKLNNYLKILSAVGVAAAMSVAAISTAQAQARIKWKMQSAFGSQLSHLGTSGVRFTKNIARMTAGKFQIKFFEPGALVPALECFKAASKGLGGLLLDHARLPHRRSRRRHFLLHGRALRAAVR